MNIFFYICFRQISVNKNLRIMSLLACLHYIKTEFFCFLFVLMIKSVSISITLQNK